MHTDGKCLSDRFDPGLPSDQTALVEIQAAISTVRWDCVLLTCFHVSTFLLFSLQAWLDSDNSRLPDVSDTCGHFKKGASDVVVFDDGQAYNSVIQRVYHDGSAYYYEVEMKDDKTGEWKLDDKVFFSTASVCHASTFPLVHNQVFV